MDESDRCSPLTVPIHIFLGGKDSGLVSMQGTLRIFLTGAPGSGKSTLLLRIIEQLRADGFRVGGILTPEFRRDGRRMGFKVVDLTSGKDAVLASSALRSGPQVGRYRVDLNAFEQVALPALEYAMHQCDIVAVDEIGRMELFSTSFQKEVERILDSGCSLIAVLHRDLVGTYSQRGSVVTVTPENRESLAPMILRELRHYLDPRAFSA